MPKSPKRTQFAANQTQFAPDFSKYQSETLFPERLAEPPITQFVYPIGSVFSSQTGFF